MENKYDFLHAGAVDVEGKAILFIAPSMGGKSTLTDYFIKKGHQLISDDKVAMFKENEKFMAVSSHSYHRPYRKIETLGEKVNSFSCVSKPIDTLYVLDRINAHAPVKINEIKGYEKLDFLLPNYLYWNILTKSKRLKIFLNLLSNVKVYRIQYPSGMYYLEDVYHSILQNEKSL